MSYKPDSAVRWIVLHYSATYIENDTTIEHIDEMHRARGFREVGYHWYVRKDGKVFMGRDLSQPGRFEVGAHSQGENSASIGICYEGGLTKATGPNVGLNTMTKAQEKSIIDLIDKMQERFPGTQLVRGHRDMPGAATQCPGFDVTAWWDKVLTDRQKPKGLLSVLIELLGNLFKK